MVGLTTILQSELDKINSSVKLLTSEDTTIKMNFDDWVFAEFNRRSIQVCNFSKSKERQLQIVDREIIAGQITTTDLKNIAFIIDCWLSKNQTVGQLQDNYNTFHIPEKYLNLLTLNVKELLEKRWTSEYERIKKQDIYKKDKESQDKINSKINNKMLDVFKTHQGTPKPKDAANPNRSHHPAG